MQYRSFTVIAFGFSLFAACEEGDIVTQPSAGAAGEAASGGSAGEATGGSGGKATGGSAGSNATGGTGAGEGGSGGGAGETGEAGANSSGGSGDSGAGGEAGSSPADNDLCVRGCVLTLAADCDNGPASQQGCVSDCRRLLNGACGTEYETLRTCADGEEVTCGQMGYPIIEACSNEQSDFLACMN